MGPKESNEEILRYAKEKNTLSKIRLLEPVPPEVIYQEEKDADILVLFEDLGELGPISRTTMTGKLFEYLPFRAPIVIIARADSDMKNILNDTSKGYLVSNIDQLDRVMNDILKGSVPTYNWPRIKKYSQESQCKLLCDILDQIILKQ